MNLTHLIGNTPLIELKNLNKNKSVQILAKLEGKNPGGSVKDRAAYGMIKGALVYAEKHFRVEPRFQLLQCHVEEMLFFVGA